MRSFLDRVTEGLFHDVNQRERQYSNRQRIIWTQTYGEMLELYVTDLVDEFAPINLATGSRFIYSEDDLKRAFSGKVCDMGIDFGVDFCAIEVVSGRVTVDTRIRGEVDKFERDTNRLVIEKARQLNELSLCVLSNEPVLTDRPRVHGRTIFPIIVNFASYPVNPLSRRYIDARLKDQSLLQDPRIRPLSILGVHELEVLQLAIRSRHFSLPDVLRLWQQSSLCDMLLYSFLHSRSFLSDIDGDHLFPIAQIDVFELAMERLGLEDGDR